MTMDFLKWTAVALTLAVGFTCSVFSMCGAIALFDLSGPWSLCATIPLLAFWVLFTVTVPDWLILKFGLFA